MTNSSAKKLIKDTWIPSTRAIYERGSQTCMHNDATLFELALLHHLHGENEWDAEGLDEQSSVGLRKNRNAGNPRNDGGIDGFYIDADRRTLFVYSAKMNNLRSEDAEKLVTDFHALLKAAKNKKNDDDNYKLLQRRNWKSLHNGLKLALDEDEPYSVVLRACTTGEVSKETRKRIEARRKSLFEDWDPSDIDVTCECLNAEGLEHEASAEDLKKILVTFSASDNSDNEMVYDLSEKEAQTLGVDKKSYVLLLSGKSIGDVARRYRKRLFDKNVRAWQGNRGRNKKIYEELKGEPDLGGPHRLWFGHNGITIVCDGISFERTNGKIATTSLLNPQIVNGCQTANTLSEFYEKEADSNPGDCTVTARIVVTQGTTQIADFIARATNTQTAITDADLKANDPLIKRVEKACEKLPEPQNHLFLRKSGQYEAAQQERRILLKYQINNPPRRKDDYRIVDRDNYQQAFRAFLQGDPANAVSKKQEVWKSEKVFRQVFGEKNPTAVIASVFAAKFSRYVKELLIEKSDGSHSLFSTISPGHKRDGQQRAASAQLSGAKDLAASHVLTLLGDAFLIVNGHSKVYDDSKSKEWNITNRIQRLLDVSPGVYFELLEELPKTMWKDDLRETYVEASAFPFGNFLKASISAMGKCALVWTETGPKENLVGDIKTPLKRSKTLREGFIGTSPQAEFLDNTVHYNITEGNLKEVLLKRAT